LESFPIGMGDTFIIGREDGNDIVIDNLACHSTTPRSSPSGRVSAHDLHSENGTFVNEQRIKAHWLADGDVSPSASTR